MIRLLLSTAHDSRAHPQHLSMIGPKDDLPWAECETSEQARRDLVGVVTAKPDPEPQASVLPIMKHFASFLNPLPMTFRWAWQAATSANRGGIRQTGV